MGNQLGMHMPYVSPQGMILGDTVCRNVIKIDTMNDKSVRTYTLIDEHMACASQVDYP